MPPVVLISTATPPVAPGTPTVMVLGARDSAEAVDPAGVIATPLRPISTAPPLVAPGIPTVRTLLWNVRSGDWTIELPLAPVPPKSTW